MADVRNQFDVSFIFYTTSSKGYIKFARMYV